MTRVRSIPSVAALGLASAACGAVLLSGAAGAAEPAPTTPTTPTARTAPGASSGPGVTTFVFSDAPVPVRREAARNDAPVAAPRVPEGFNPYRIAYVPGAYRCELGRSVQVRTVSADLRTTELRWAGGDYTLRSVEARSGALRYEDAASGLAWIVLKDRSMLLDTRAGQRLANACRTSA